MASTSGRAAYVGTHRPLPMRRSTRAASPLEPPPLGLSYLAGRTARAEGRRCLHVARYKRNEWIKYMPEKHNPHDYDDPATFAEVRPLPLPTPWSAHTPEVSSHARVAARFAPPSLSNLLLHARPQPSGSPHAPDCSRGPKPSPSTPQLEELVTGILLRFPEGVNRRKLLRILDQQGHYFGGMEGQTLAYHLVHRMQDGDLAWCVLSALVPCREPTVSATVHTDGRARSVILLALLVDYYRKSRVFSFELRAGWCARERSATVTKKHACLWAAMGRAVSGREF